jgi:hypothetical protein
MRPRQHLLLPILILLPALLAAAAVAVDAAKAEFTAITELAR